MLWWLAKAKHLDRYRGLKHPRAMTLIGIVPHGLVQSGTALTAKLHGWKERPAHNPAADNCCGTIINFRYGRYVVQARITGVACTPAVSRIIPQQIHPHLDSRLRLIFLPQQHRI
jgi:hypothetical protein